MKSSADKALDEPIPSGRGRGVAVIAAVPVDDTAIEEILVAARAMLLLTTDIRVMLSLIFDYYCSRVSQLKRRATASTQQGRYSNRCSSLCNDSGASKF